MADQQPPDNSPDTTDTADDVAHRLTALRDGITEVDGDLLALLAKRRELAREVATLKSTVGRSIRDQVREEDLLATLIERGHTQGLDPHYVTRLFHVIIDDSVKLQQALLVDQCNPDATPPKIRVAFQGDRGSYSHVAICQHFSDRLEDVAHLGFEAFAEAVEAVEHGIADFAMLPIENTTSGGINEVYDLLMHTPLSVVGEETVRIDHCLLARPGTTIASLGRVYAHPQGFAQCSRYVAEHLRHCRLESLETAEAVRRAAQGSNPAAAAIASVQAGELFGLVPLADGIANQRENVTRFLCVAPNARHVPRAIASKTSLVMATSDAPGSLVEALALFRDAGLSMCKLESRPIIGNPWEEMFYVDVAANIDDEPFRDTLDRLKRVTRYLKVLGCYPAHQLPATQVPPARWVAATATAGRPAEPTAPSGGGATPAPAAGEVPGGDQPPAATGSVPSVRIGNLRLGSAESFAFIAGPAAVASLASARAAATVAARSGVQALAFGLRGDTSASDSADWRQQLEWMVEAARDTGLACIATVTRPHQVAAAAATADAVRVGGRYMDDVELLRAVGSVARPVVLTRGRAASVKDLLAAADTVRGGGNRQVVLSDAGTGSPDSHGDVTLDPAAVVRLRRSGAGPVLVEPARALDDADNLTAPLIAAARAAGGNGCILCFEPDSSAQPMPGVVSAAALGEIVREILASP